MSGTKISALTAKGTLEATDLLPIVDETGTPTTKNITGAVLKTFVSDSPTLVTPDLGTPASGTLTNCTFPTLNQNTSGTAANLSGTPSLPNGTTATTQTAGDNSTKLATTAYVDSNSTLTKVATASPSSVSSFTISSLSPGVKYKLIFNLLQNTSNANPIGIQFNGDSGNNYNYQVLIIANGTPQGGYGSGVSQGNLTYGNQIAGLPFQGEILFQSVQGTNTSVLYSSYVNEGNNTSVYLPALSTGRYTGASNLSSVTITTSAGTMTGKATLYQIA